MAALCAHRRKARVAACAFLNLTAGCEINSHMSIFGWIDNLTNEHYAEVFGFPNLGRAAYAGVNLRF
jgi:vitamin B12 transporter